MRTTGLLGSIFVLLTCLIPAPAFAQNHYKIFDPVVVQTVTTGSTFNTATLSLTCTSAPSIKLSSNATSSTNVFIDNYIAASINGGAANDVCVSPDGSNDNGVNNCFRDVWKTNANTSAGRNPDTYPGFLTTNGVPPFNISGLPAGTNLTVRLDMMDNGGYIGSSSIYVDTNCTLPSISGFVYIDRDKDGTRDGAEGGPGSTMYAKLLSSSGAFLQLANVDPTTGAYSFTGVVNGNYTVIVDTNNTTTDVTPGTPANYQFATPSTGSAAAVISSQTAPVVNFGIIPTASVSGTVYLDANNNGVKNNGETGSGLAVIVKLINSSGVVVDVATASATTGNYTFSNVFADTYNIIIDDNVSTSDTTPTAPLGLAFQTPATGSRSTTVATASVTTQDFGVVPSIAGYVYMDANLSGAYNAGDPVVPATMYVKLISGSTVQQVVPANATTGAYAFTRVASGTYTVIVDTNNSTSDVTAGTPSGYAFVAPSGGSLSVTTANAAVANQNFGFAPTISGTVFEDVLGTGASTGTARNAVAVRLYADVNNNGVVDTGDTYVSATTTNASGFYSFAVATTSPGPRYLVAVNSKTISPTTFNSGFTIADVWAEQTYGDDPTTPALDLGPRFGGLNGAVSDVFPAATAPANNSYEHLARIDVTCGPVANANFGFSFNVVTNTRAGDAADDDASANRTVQGSLRQFLQNARAIPGANAMRFVPAVAANAGTFWRVSVTTALPVIDDANTTIDGTAFSSADGATVLDANTGSLGTGGAVGVDGTTLAQVARPELEIVNARATTVIPIGLNITASAVAVRDIAIYGFGSASNVNTSGNIVLATTAASAMIESNLIGTGATAFTDPGAAARSVGDNIRILGTPTVTVRNNLIGFSAGKGIDVASGSTSFSLTGNEVRGNGLGATYPGLDLHTSSAAVTANLFAANTGSGLDTSSSTGANSIVNNTISGNGVGTNYAGIRIYGAGNTIDRNIVTANLGSGVLVTSSASTNTITKNSIYQNGTATSRIGIDLLATGNDQNVGTSPFVSINDINDADTGGNGVLNFPIITTAIINGSNLELSGYARPGAAIEFFIADPAANGFGQGRTYLTTLVEGSGSDTDATTGTYGPAAINGFLQGTDTTNRFKFSIPLPAGVSLGTTLTATATLGGNTSEFSGNAQVAASSTVTGNVYEDANHNGLFDTTPAENWNSGPLVYVNLVSGGAVLKSTTVAAASAGSFSFSALNAGTYTMVVTNNATSVTPAAPAGWSFVQPANGSLSFTIGTSTLANQTFGLYHGSSVSGTVFTDNGLGAGNANDGARNGGEAGLAGVTVTLTDAGGATTYASATTDAAGQFTLNVPGTLASPVVAITNPANYVNTGGNAGTTGGTYNNATARVAFTNTNGSSYTGLLFGVVAANTFDSAGELASTPGTAVAFPHVYTPATAGTVTFTASAATTPSVSGFTQVLYRDLNCNGTVDPTDTVISAPIATTAATPVCILIKDFIPNSAPIGTLDSLTIVAAFTYANNASLVTTSSSLNVHDLTRVDVQSSTLRLVKSVSAAAALPGTSLTYTLNFFNAGATPISNLVIYDSTPAYTVFVSAACPSTLPPSLTGCTLVAPAVDGVGGMSWTFTGTLLSGQSGTVTFQAKIQ